VPRRTISVVDGESVARAWVEGWTKGWEAGDAEAIGCLYAADAVFRSHPFREPERSARDYALRAFADEELVECRFGEPVVDGDRAAVEYWAILSAEGDEETLAGIALIRFGDDGLVVEQRDYWSMQPGRAPAPF
jgi:SnoaL-like domain